MNYVKIIGLIWDIVKALLILFLIYILSYLSFR